MYKTETETLDDFVKKFQPILDWNEQFEKESKALTQLYPSSFVVPEGGKLLDSYIQLLADYYNDEGEWIEYYCWECEFGAKPQDVLEDGKVAFHLGCVGDLWNILGVSNERWRCFWKKEPLRRSHPIPSKNRNT